MNRTSMPLVCTICERRPSFSDISHLLTHISSKQHLSNYFKIQVQSSGDDDAQGALDQYNAWYEQWNMAELLKDRMDQKGKKKTHASRRATGQAAKPTKDRKNRSNRRTETRKREQIDHNLEPRIKVEPNIRSYTPLHSLAIGTNYSTRSALSTISGWPDEPRDFKNEEYLSSEPDGPATYDPSLSDIYAPLSPRRCRQIYRQATRTTNALLSSSLDSSASIEDVQEEVTKEGIKLKGVVWPGMDLFDSATPEMQRKRNQKKATNVVAQLEATSKTVEPDELIFDLSGEFLLQRKISGNPDLDGTPLKGETTPEPDSPPAKKKKRTWTRRQKAPLADRDENGGAARARARRAHTTFGNKRKASYNNTSDDVDDSLTYGRAQGRNSLSIHRDNSGPDITFGHSQSHGHMLSSYPYAPSGISGVRPQSRFSQTRADSVLGLSARHNSHDVEYLGYKSASGQFRPAMSMNGSDQARDLSAFGQINLFQPSFNPFSAIESSVQQSNPFHGLASVAGQQNTMPQSHAHDAGLHLSATNNYGTNSSHQLWSTLGNQGMMDGTASFGLFDSWSGLDGQQTSVNPLYFGSDQVFGEDTEILGNTVPKQEPDDDAETISLASDQK